MARVHIKISEAEKRMLRIIGAEHGDSSMGATSGRLIRNEYRRMKQDERNTQSQGRG